MAPRSSVYVPPQPSRWSRGPQVVSICSSSVFTVVTWPPGRQYMFLLGLHGGHVAPRSSVYVPPQPSQWSHGPQVVSICSSSVFMVVTWPPGRQYMFLLGLHGGHVAPRSSVYVPPQPSRWLRGPQVVSICSSSAFTVVTWPPGEVRALELPPLALNSLICISHIEHK